MRTESKELAYKIGLKAAVGVRNRTVSHLTLPAVLVWNVDSSIDKLCASPMVARHYFLLAFDFATSGGPTSGGISPVKEFKNACRSLRSCPVKKSST